MLHTSQDGVLLASYHDMIYHMVWTKEARQEAAVVFLFNICRSTAFSCQHLFGFVAGQHL